MWRVPVVVGLVAVLGVGTVTPALGRPPDRQWHGHVYDIAESDVVTGAAKAIYFVDGPAGPDPSATSRVEFRVSVGGLDPGHAYTVWLMLFNHSENCTHGDGDRNLCGPDDFTDPATLPSLMWGTGGVAGEDGSASFTGSRRQGDLDRVLLGPGLVNPAQAEVHMVVRDHGEHDPETYGDRQTQSFNGGCGDVDPGPVFDDAFPSRCEDVQTTLV